ncbi:hypothetical protein [Coleofasciculus sp.]|uniref:hypothetical protein n=1 Tax=Coleofasciculus sp. TaxID=3100458 RepID=UPI003A1F13D2
MINHISTLICLKSIVNEETKNITLVEIIEQFNIDNISSSNENQSIILPDFELVSFWGRKSKDEPSQGSARLCLMSPSRNILFQKEYKIDLSNNLRCNAIFKISGLEIQEEGDYEFHIKLIEQGKTKWKTVGKALLPIEAI